MIRLHDKTDSWLPVRRLCEPCSSQSLRRKYHNECGIVGPDVRVYTLVNSDADRHFIFFPSLCWQITVFLCLTRSIRECLHVL